MKTVAALVTITLNSLSVLAAPKPVAVRYAWDFRFAWANLFNKDGYPALGFRTDNWN